MVSHTNFMQRRGQVTIFIVLAVLIVAVIITYFSSSFFDFTSEDVYSSEVSVYRDSMVACLTTYYEDALRFMGYQGGYFETTPEMSFYTGVYSASYYYRDGRVYAPSESDVSAALVSALHFDASFCLDTVATETLSVTYSDPRFSVDFADDSVTFTTTLTATVVENDSSTVVDFSRYPVTLPSRMSDFIEASQKLVSIIQSDAGASIPLSQMTNIAREYGFTSDVYFSGIDNSTYFHVWSVSEEGTHPLFWQFIIEYDFIDIPFPTSFGN